MTAQFEAPQRAVAAPSVVPPVATKPADAAESPALLEVRGLVENFHVRVGRHSVPVHAVAGVDLDVRRGEVYGLVGESGSGKTTLARCVLRLLDVDTGTIRFDGVDLAAAKGPALREMRSRIQVVFQDPVGSLDPRNTVRQIVSEPLRLHSRLSGTQIEERTLKVLDDVGLGAHQLKRHAHELSGGQCQRVAIARALALKPEMLVLDEPTSSLDVSVQAQILNLLGDLRREYGLTYLLISHDLAVVRHVCDRIGVMYLGRLVEESPAEPLFVEPRHPYTRALLAASPDIEGTRERQLLLAGDPPSATAPPPGCVFHPRCWLYQQLAAPQQCVEQAPDLVTTESTRRVACHFSDSAQPPVPER
jgi:peptide/nickel transport system ATP-binding protein